MFKFYLDSTEVQQPRGWEDLKSTLKRDDGLNAVLLSIDADLEFSGDAYTLLADKLETDGFCSTVSISIHQHCYGETYKEIITGTIFLTDVIFNERTCIAKTKLEDSSYFAKINANKKIKTSPDSGRSKLEASITAATVYEVDMYDLDNVSMAYNVATVRVEEAFRYLIDFMSDGTIGFTSTTFGIGGQWEGLCVTTGARIRTGNAIQWTAFSFDELFNEVNARIPITLTVENPYTSPVIRIEDRDYYYAATIALDIDNIYEISSRCETSKLYSSINVGSSVVDDTVTLSFPEDIDYFGFKEEEYFFRTSCNSNEAGSIEAVGEWAVSSNIIEKCITPILDQAYDDTIFILDTVLTSSVAGRTYNSNFLQLSPAVYYYNERLTNRYILDRYNGGIPGTAARYTGTLGDGLFKAFRSSNLNFPATTTVYSPFAFTNVATNTGGYYDGTDTFTALIAGVYKFRTLIVFNVDTNPVSTGLSAKINHYDSSNALLATYTLAFVSLVVGQTGTNLSISGDETIVMREGDYCTFELDYATAASNPSTGSIRTSSYWECYFNTNGGGDYTVSESTDYPVRLHEFEYPISYDDFTTITANASGYIRFRMADKAWRKGWIKEIIYSHVTGQATFKLITNKDTIDAN